MAARERAAEALRIARRLTRRGWRLHAFAVICLYPVIPARARGATCRLRITLPSGASRWFWFTDLTQVSALREVLIERDYDVELSRPVRTIVDLGANAGQASLFLHDRYPEARILAAEPDPQIASLAARNLRGIADVIPVGVADRDGTMEFTRVLDLSWGSALGPARYELPSEHLSVPTMTLGTLLREHRLDRIDLLKVDVEGAELTALTSDDSLQWVRCLIGEVHPWLIGMTAPEALERLREHGGFDRGWMHRERIVALVRTDPPAR